MGKKVATTIGSLPHTEPGKACELVLKYTPELPAWPQLPKRTFLENMCAQYSEAFPGIKIDRAGEKIFLDAEAFNAEFASFVQKTEAGAPDDFAISKKHAAGFHDFLSLVSPSQPGVKCQTVGPVTFGMTVKDTAGRSIYYEQSYRQALELLLVKKSLWQLEKIRAKCPSSGLVLFYDEPYLAAYGSAFAAISREDITASLRAVTEGVKAVQPGVKVGVHCCANTDWSVLCDAGIDIISFDAYEFADSLGLYAGQLSAFLGRGGTLAWGIVPTGEELLAKETAGQLRKRLSESVEKLASRGVDPARLKENLLVTPSCGLGSRSIEAAEKAHSLLSEIIK